MEKQWVNIYLNNPDGWNLLLGVAFVATGLWLVTYVAKLRPDNLEWLNFIPHRGGRMLRKARRDFVRQQATYDFTNAVEERVYSGLFTREEAKELYRDMKKCFPIRDLFPSPQLLKEAIQKRRQAGIHNPVELPDRQPEFKPKHCFDKLAKE